MINDKTHEINHVLCGWSNIRYVFEAGIWRADQWVTEIPKIRQNPFTVLQLILRVSLQNKNFELIFHFVPQLIHRLDPQILFRIFQPHLAFPLSHQILLQTVQLPVVRTDYASLLLFLAGLGFWPYLAIHVLCTY